MLTSFPLYKNIFCHAQYHEHITSSQQTYINHYKGKIKTIYTYNPPFPLTPNNHINIAHQTVSIINSILQAKIHIAHQVPFTLYVSYNHMQFFSSHHNIITQVFRLISTQTKATLSAQTPKTNNSLQDTTMSFQNMHNKKGAALIVRHLYIILVIL